MKSKKSVLFLAGILLIGILTLLPYGSYIDQACEQKILFANIKEYMLHLPGDVPDVLQSLMDSPILRISVDEDRDHGIAVYYLAFPVWYINRISPYWGGVFWHFYTFLLVFWGMCSLFYLAKKLFHEEKLAVFLTLLFFLTPRMFAESHYNNKDVVLLSLTFTLFYWGKRLLEKQSIKNVCIFAVVGALASNLKFVGIWLFGALGLYLLFYFIVTKQFHGMLPAKTAGCILLWAAVYLLLTPACWPDMAAFFKFSFFGATDYDLWHDNVLFGGKMVHRDYTGIPKKYLPVMICLTTPVGILLLTLLGGIWAAADFVRKKGKCLEDTGYVLAMILIGVVPLTYAVLSATPVYNGWRHFYFVYASMIMAAGYGAFRLWKTADRHSRTGNSRARVFAEAAAALYILVLAAGIFLNFPQEHSYYNLLSGKNLVERYELDYWDMSMKQAYESVLRQLDGGKTTVGTLNMPTKWGVEDNWKTLPKKAQDIISVAEKWQDAEYVFINTTYAYMYSNDDYNWIRENYDLTDSFASYGNVICEVYRKK